MPRLYTTTKLEKLYVSLLGDPWTLFKEDPLDKEDSHAASLSNGFMFNLMTVPYIVDW